MSSKRNYSKVSNKQNNHFNWFLLPLIMAITLIPLIVRGHDYNTNLSQFSWFPSNDASYDFFLYYKSVWFITISSFALIPLILKIIKEKKSAKFTVAFIPLGVYAFFIIASSLFSNYSYFSFHGISEHFESVFVLISYCVLTIYAFMMINNEDDVKNLFKYWIVGIVVLCLLGISQFTGYDFFTTLIGKKLITPRVSWGELDSLSFTFEAKRVYLSFYNPNYVGLYTSLVTPIFFVMIIFQKNKKNLAIYSFIFVTLLLCMFGSQSRNGIIALSISLLFILILFRKILLKKWKILLIALITFIIAFFAIDSFNNHSFSSRLISMFDFKTSQKSLTAIDTNNDNIVITYNNEKLAVNLNVSDDNSISILFKDDKSGDMIKNIYDEASTSFSLDDARFPFTFKIYSLDEGNKLAFGATIEGKEWIFTNNTDDGSYYYYNQYGKLDKIVTSPSAIFTGYEDLAGRGYIWSRTIPVLKDKIILGSGADTFTIAFPQQNYVDNYNYMGTALLTKPHSLYLQIGVETGLFSLFAFLIFYCIYFVGSIKLYIKNNFETYLAQMGAAILIGTIGYMASAIVNDSTIAVSPIFWVLIGTGLSINHMVKSTSK